MLTKTSRIIIVFGLVISVLAVETAPSFIAIQDSSEQAQNKETGTEDSSQVLISANALATPFAFEININPQLFLVATLPELEEISLPVLSLSAQMLIINKELNVVLRRIISPNAP